MKKLALLALVPVTVLALTGCGGSSDAGVFRSSDGGQSFIASSQIGEESSFAREEVTTLARSPLAPSTVFAGLSGGGILVSADGGRSWSQTALASGTPYEFALSSDGKTLFAAYEAQLIKTTDGGLTYETLYADPTVIRTVALDATDASAIWIGTEAGQVLQSTDAGLTWRVAYSFKRAVVDIHVSPVDQTVYASTDTDQIVVSRDAGSTFTVVDMEEAVVAFSQASTEGSSVFAATAAGLFSSADQGSTWTALPDPLSAAGQPLNDVYVLPGDGSIVAIAAAANVSISKDGGITWQSRAVPTRRQVSSVLIFSVDTLLVGVAGGGPSFLEQTLGS